MPWSQSLNLVGPPGPAGANGLDGAPGPPGADGAGGPQGPVGPTAVSADAFNTSILGTDGLIFTPNLGGGGSPPIEFPSSGDWVKPATGKLVLVEVWGGGGSG